MVHLTINGKRIRAKEGTTLLSVIRKAKISIPTLCFHEALTPRGACRLCSVEVTRAGPSRIVTACNYPVEEGIEVETHSEAVTKARRVLVELLLARSPQVPLLQELARELGVESVRFRPKKPPDPCILCGLCVQACSEMAGIEAIAFVMRGTRRRIGTEIDPERCVACGACEYICPTGAIRMEMDRIRTMRLSNTGTQRFCRYMRMGLIDFMICSNGFECWRCEVDQEMEDRFGTHPVFALKPGRKRELQERGGMPFLQELYYSEEHVWAKPMGDLIRLGLDVMASYVALGARSVQLSSVGTEISKGTVLAMFERDGKKAEILSPVSGTVLSANHRVEESPGLSWKDPYGRGWLLMIRPQCPEEVYDLRFGTDARPWFEAKAAEFSRAMSQWGGPRSSQGGSSGDQLEKRIVEEHWVDLIEFLWGSRC